MHEPMQRTVPGLDVQQARDILNRALRSSLLQRASQCGLDLSDRTIFYAFDITDQPSAGFSVECGRGVVEVTGGVRAASDINIRIAGWRFCQLVAGNADIFELFSLGEIGVTGDLLLVQPLARVVSQLAAAPGTSRRVTRAMRDALLRKSAAQARLADIERRSQLSPERFQQEYALPGLPVIITDALEGWKLRHQTLDDLNALLGDLRVVYRRGPEVVMEAVTLRDFIEIISRKEEGPREPDTIPYIDNEVIPRVLKPLLGTLPYFAEGDLEQTGGWIPNSQGLFLGPGGTVTRLHWDMADNFLAQVWGSKRITLFPPCDAENAYMHFERESGRLPDDVVAPHLRAAVDPSAPDYDRFPNFRRAVAVRCTLEAGECLYIPTGWLHYVASQSLSLSINHLLGNRLPAALPSTV